MTILQEPPTSRYDLSFSFAGIPIRVHPAFWLMAVLFGASTGDLVHLVIWVAAVFLSILVHELGHVLIMRVFRQPARIVLYHGGGLAVPEILWLGGQRAEPALPPGQQAAVSLAGPGAGFLLAAMILAGAKVGGGFFLITTLFTVLPYPLVFLPNAGSLINLIISTLIWINLFWGLINLLPVLPLDGGRLAEILLLRHDPARGIARAYRLSWIVGGIVACLGLLVMGSMYLALFFGYLAVMSFRTVKGRFDWSDRGP